MRSATAIRSGASAIDSGHDEDEQVRQVAGSSSPSRAVNREQHERELAAACERDAETPCGGVIVTRTARATQISAALSAEQAQRQREDHERLRGEQAQVRRHADRDEEQAEQQALERLDVGLELVAILAVGEQHAGDERAERHREARTFEQQRGAEHDEQRRRRERFLDARVGNEAQHGPQRVAAGVDQITTSTSVRQRKRQRAP